MKIKYKDIEFKDKIQKILETYRVSLAASM